MPSPDHSPNRRPRRDRISPPPMPSHDGPTTSPLARQPPILAVRSSPDDSRSPTPRQTISPAAPLTRRRPPKPPVASSLLAVFSTQSLASRRRRARPRHTSPLTPPVLPASPRLCPASTSALPQGSHQYQQSGSTSIAYAPTPPLTLASNSALPESSATRPPTGTSTFLNPNCVISAGRTRQ